MRLQKDITPDFVLTMSHWQLAKLLSFTAEIGQSRSVLENYLEDRTESHTTMKAQMNHKKWEMNGMKSESSNKESNLLFWTLIQWDINPYRHILSLLGDVVPWVFVSKS